MNKVLMFSLGVFLLVGSAISQEAPAWEISGGYQFARVFDPCCESLHGFSAGLEENVNHWFGGVFEIGATFHNRAGTREQLVTFMWGPQITYRKSSSFQPFGRFLIGGARDGITYGPSDNNLSLDAGAGFDFRVARNIYFRGKADFLHTSLFNSTQKYAQAGAGIVYRLGSTSDSK